MNFKSTLITAAKKAGGFQLKHFGKLTRHDIKYKKLGEYVTYVDRISGRIISQEIIKSFPGHTIISEDSPPRRKKSDYTWYIDPLDGTTNYSIQNPLFAVAVAVAVNNEPMACVVYMPFLKQLYYAEKNRGAFMNGKKIHVSRQTDLHRSIITLSFPHRLAASEKALEIFHKVRPAVNNIRIFGSGDYSMCSVAAGRVEATLLPGEINPWDAMSGMLLVREAGGAVTDFRGDQVYRSRNLLLSNGQIHNKIIKLVSK